MKTLFGTLSGFALAVTAAAQGEIRFAQPRFQTNGELLLSWTGPAGAWCRIAVSSNLAQWTPLVTFQNAGAGQHLDSGTPWQASRFYRGEVLAGAGYVSGDHLATTNGDVVIHPVYHASLALQWGSKLIYVDPANNSFAGLPKADLILYTHDHGDHFNANAIAGLTNTGARIGATLGVYARISTALRSLTTALTNGATTNLHGVGIEAVPAYNLDNTPHTRGTNNNGYILTIGGRRLYVAGDTEDTPEMRALRDIEVAFLPMNLPFTMSVAQAASAVNAFLPRVVYPFHYRNQDNSLSDVNSFKQQVRTNQFTEVRLRNWY
jgi:L-ascorbate metabolism protein UlaG (beta-lactamase superfamily)